MNLLALTNRAKQECGIPGGDLTTILNPTREIKRLIDWIVQGWVDIQNERHDWFFLRKNFTFNTVAGKQNYTIAEIGLTDYKLWVNDSFREYLLSAGVATEIILSQYYNYTEFRDFYLLGSRKLVTGRPLYITIAPDRSLSLGFTPNDIYVVTGEYYRSAQRLTADASIPIIPEDYHMLIVYKAMQKYGMFESANEVVISAKEEYSRMYSRLVFDQTPMIQLGGSMI